jgi:hypothetical protein
MRRDSVIRAAIVAIPGVAVLAVWKPDTWPAVIAFLAFVTALGYAADAGLRRWG